MKLFGLLGLLFLGAFVPALAQDSIPQAGDVRTDAFGIEQVYVPAGCFMMGSSEDELAYAQSLNPPAWVKQALNFEKEQHTVCLSSGYWLDRYEVTNAAFQAFVDAGGYSTQDYWSKSGWAWAKTRVDEGLPIVCEDSEPDHPRVCVTWYEAEAYAAWRSGALPSEAQWEYAACGPDSLIYPWGNEWDTSKANVENSTGLSAVGAYPAGVSWVGAFDMAGNAMEWVQDWLSFKYSADDATDPTGPKNGKQKAEKGGWWGSNPVVARAAYHHYEDPPRYQDHHIGFRIVTPAS